MIAAGRTRFIVDNAGDVVIAGDSRSLIESSIDWTLTQNVARLTLVGSSAVRGVGNEMDNELIGNAADNVLEGRNGNDTSDTANDLGDLTAIARLQVTGTIGDDRFYNIVSVNPFARNPAADVDLYRFSITGDGTFGLIAESFAGRIGSPLDPALTLFRADDAGALQLVATNNNSLNSMGSTNGQFPFAADAVLFSGLSAGEYFLAVSSSGPNRSSGASCCSALPRVVDTSVAIDMHVDLVTRVPERAHATG